MGTNVIFIAINCYDTRIIIKIENLDKSNLFNILLGWRKYFVFTVAVSFSRKKMSLYDGLDIDKEDGGSSKPVVGKKDY